jgi:hypothetical protein
MYCAGYIKTVLLTAVNVNPVAPDLVKSQAVWRVSNYVKMYLKTYFFQQSKGISKI